MMSKFCENISNYLGGDKSKELNEEAIFHPKFKKKRITTFPDGANAISAVTWNYELEGRWKKNSKLVCYDENDDEIQYAPYEPNKTIVYFK